MELKGKTLVNLYATKDLTYICILFINFYASTTLHRIISWPVENKTAYKTNKEANVPSL